MAVHFKFRSAVEYDSVSLDGNCISIANLKEKIAEQKNLGKGTDFDLLITNAETGEEYTHDSFLVPKNTSVVIKRVPATRAKPTLLVPNLSKAEGSQQTCGTYSRDVDATLAPLATSMDDLYDLDDFGVDLYAFDEPVTQHVEAEEDREISAIMTEKTSDWNRYTLEAFTGGRGYGRGVFGRGCARGHSYGRSIPPASYVCHRCGQPGHFIQHCPTNGDPAYDMKRVKLPVGIAKARLNADQDGSYILPDGPATAIQADETAFTKEVDAQMLMKPAQMERPCELQCSLCQGIFKDAVMIPCCHHSFCDKCIRQTLIEIGKCPQCEATKLKDEDVLPNIALRQAIDRFMDAQPCTTADEGASKQQQAPDVESATRKVSSPASLGVKKELLKSSAANMNPWIAIVNKIRPDQPNITDSVCESVIGPKEETVVDDSKIFAEAANASVGIDCVHKSDESEGPTSKVSEDVANHAVMKAVSGFVKEAKQHVNDIGESAIVVSKFSEPPSYKEAEGVALEPEMSKGKKKKKWNRSMPTDGVVEHLITGKPRKMDRYCYICGSPEHLARDCHRNAANNPVGYLPQQGMFRPVGPISPGIVSPPYGQEMYWHGPPIPHVRPFRLGYGEAMYGPCPVALPFESPIIPVGPFGIASYMPPMYSNPPLHSGFMKAMRPGLMVPMDRPLTREEFIELQERERRRRLIQGRQERDCSEDRADSRDGVGHSLSTDLEHRTQKHHLSDDDEYEGPSSKHDFDRNSVRNYSDEADHRKKSKRNRRHTSERLTENSVHHQPERASDGDMALDCSKSHRSQSGKRHQKVKSFPSEIIRECSYHWQASDEGESCDEQDDGQHSFSVRGSEKMLREGEYVRSSRQSGSSRYDALYFEKYESSSSKKYDGDIIFCSELGSGEGSHVSRHRNKRTASEGSKYNSQSERSSLHFEHHCEGATEIEDRHHVHGFVNYDDVSPKDEENNSKKHQHAKCRSDTDSMNHESEDESKKKKRRHKKRNLEETQYAASEYMEEIVVGVLNCQKHKSNHTFQVSDKHMSVSPQLEASPVGDNLGQSRWQMDCGMDQKDDG